MKLVALLLLVGLVLVPYVGEAKPLHGPPDCVRLYVGVAQEDGVPSPWLGQKVGPCLRLGR